MNPAFYTLPQGRIESPADGSLASRDRMHVTGWALDGGAPLLSVLLTVNGKVAGSAEMGLPRPAVAERYAGIPHAASSGWQITVSLRDETGQDATLGLLALTRGGDWFELARVTVPLTPLPAKREETRQPRAVFTIVQDEPVFLPIWLAYYRRNFGADDIYVLDHDGPDGLAEQLKGKARVVPVHCSESFNHLWLRDTVRQFQAFLLQSYRTVLFAEVDELVAPAPRTGRDLANYMDTFEGSVARCTGFNVVQAPGETPIDFSAPLLAQRAFWHPAPSHSKLLMSRAPLDWIPGFHEALNFADVASDPDLYLIHLHRVDYNYCLSRHESAARRTWSEFDVRHQMGWQNRVVDPDAFREWYYAGPDLAGQPKLAIPDDVRTLL